MIVESSTHLSLKAIPGQPTKHSLDILYLQGGNGKIRNGSFSWSDGRPFVRNSWTQRYIHQPIGSRTFLRLHDSWLLLQTLSELSHTLQPDPNITMGCTLGIVSPYTGGLDWVSVGCNSIITIPLVACQRGSVSHKHNTLKLIYLSALFQHLMTCGKSDSYFIRYNVTSCVLNDGNEEATHPVLSPWIKQLCFKLPFLSIMHMYTCHTQFYPQENLDYIMQGNVSYLGQSKFCPKYHIYSDKSCYHRFFANLNIDGIIASMEDTVSAQSTSLHGNQSILISPQSLGSCAHFLFECQNGECISLTNLLDGKGDCPHEEDESNHQVTDVRHLYCPDSKCVPWEQVCDHMMQCITNHSFSPYDEVFNCSDGSITASILVDDLVADCQDSSDEPLLLNLTTSFPEAGYDVCPKGQIACYPGHTMCYAPHHACKMAYTNFGTLRYCRNGEHLRSCEDFSCSGMYKCPLSYCVPFQMICDDNVDCPNGEDELGCHKNVTCPGLLRCRSGGCVHPINVCDGETDCPEGDDEMLCELANCPENCSCLGVSMICMTNQTTAEIVDISLYKQVIILYPNTFPILHNGSQLLRLDLSGSAFWLINYNYLFEMEKLVFLDLSACNILQLPKRLFKMQANIEHLNLSSNGLIMIPKLTFNNNKLLANLDISSQKLSYLEWNLFSNLDNLQYLNLSHNELTMIDFDQVLKVSTPLNEFIITGNNIVEALYSTVSPENMFDVQIVTDSIGVCCVVNVTSCGELTQYADFCNPMMSVVKSSERVVFTCLFMCIGLLNIISLTVRSIRETNAPSRLSMEISSLPKAVHLAMFSVLHIWVPGLPGPYSFKHIWCVIAGSCQLYSILLTLSASVITSVEFHNGLSSIKRFQLKYAFINLAFVNALITVVCSLYFTGLFGSDIPIPGPACSLLLWRSSKHTPDFIIMLLFLSVISGTFCYIIYKSQQTYQLVLMSSQYLHQHMSIDVAARRQRQVILYLVANLLMCMMDNIAYIAGIVYSLFASEAVNGTFVLLLIIPTCFHALVSPQVYLARVVKTILFND